MHDNNKYQPTDYKRMQAYMDMARESADFMDKRAAEREAKRSKLKEDISAVIFGVTFISLVVFGFSAALDRADEYYCEQDGYCGGDQ